MKKFILLFLGFLIGLFYAQEIHVQGKITDSSNDEPVANAIIQTKNQQHKTTSDFEGNFEIIIEKGSEFVVAQKDYAPSFGESETPVHKKFDVLLGYKPLKGLSIGGAILNITDEDYYNHLSFSFVNQPSLNGRQIYKPRRSLV